MDKHRLFLQALHNKKKVKVKINSKEKGIIERVCVPFDFGPSRRAKDNKKRYHFCDLDSPDGIHVLSILPEQLISIELLDEGFEPADYITWKKIMWFIPRDWGEFS